MNSDLPATGTAALLELLHPFVPDDFINECWPHGHTGGRRRDYSAAQLYRIHLLSLLTPVHSVNLLVKLLPEQRAWRKFAGLRRQTQVPGVRVLHEFRGRVHHYSVGVQLVPLVSWVSPANVSEGGLLVPSLHYCQRQWDWGPPLVVADMGYLGAPAKRQCREQWGVSVLTKLRSDMKLVPPYVAWNQTACPQGEPLTWLGYDGRAGEHWFGVGPRPELCGGCWEAARCPRQFAHRPAEHETLLGRLPLASRAARVVLQQVRPWIEPAQSFEKNQLGLSDLFLNSLRFTWVMGLLADAVVVLRAQALLGRPPRRPLLASLLPCQLPLELGEETTTPFSSEQITNPQNPQ